MAGKHEGMTLRAARPGDEADIHRMIIELAEYEGSADSVTSTATDLADALFGEAPAVFCQVAQGTHRLDGFALWYTTYSTWTGRHGIWLEDLYVRPDCRGRGIARALLAGLAAECERRGYRRLEWWVLDWNSPALRFYESIGATPMAEWTVQRLDGEALSALAATTTPGAATAATGGAGKGRGTP